MIFRRKLAKGAAFTAADVCQFMRLAKESRLSETPNHRDSLVDIPGYSDCQAIVTRGRRK